MISITAMIVLALAAAVGLLLVYAATRPGSFQIARSASINCTPDQLFPLISDLKSVNTWNPYALRDPNAKASYSGPASGKGAAHAFEGPKSGTGRLEIVDATAPAQVTMRLTMVKPMQADNTVRFTLEPRGHSTTVTWAMDGKTPFLGKIVSLFLDCDRMVGKDFEEGLANLRLMAERSQSNPA
jgi:hypothetical protein